MVGINYFKFNVFTINSYQAHLRSRAWWKMTTYYTKLQFLKEGILIKAKYETTSK